MLQLNEANYFSQEANWDYMSTSQYQDFTSPDEGCEARAMATLKGEWEEPENKAFLVGSYVHAWAENKLREWIVEHPECCKRDGSLKAEYVQANDMIERLKRDDFAMYMLTNGHHEVIVTAELFGEPFKTKVDVYAPELGRMIDLKTARSIRERHWDAENRRWVSFIEHYGYMTRTAIYGEVERLATGRDSWLSAYIVAVSKEEPPDLAVISLWDPDRWADELTVVRNNLPRILAVKSGQEEPRRC